MDCEPEGLPGKGKKRSASLQPPVSPPPSKKAHRDVDITVISENRDSPSTQLLLVLSHTLVIQPTSRNPQSLLLVEPFLSSFENIDEPIPLCGRVEFTQLKKSNVTFACLPPTEKYRASDLLFPLPPLDGLPAGESCVIRSEEIGVPTLHRFWTDDWLNAAVFLSETEDTVHVVGVLHVQRGVAVGGEHLGASLPFHFELAVSVSLKPSFFHRIDPLSDPRRLLLYTAFPPREFNSLVVGRVTSDTGGVEYKGETSAGYFYECLRPAPRGEMDVFSMSRYYGLRDKGKARDSNEMDWAEAKAREDLPVVRPPGLIPRLLPFQSRTVRWLLWREGQTVKRDVLEAEGTEDSVMPLNGETLRELVRGPLWEKVTTVQGEGLWLNRVSTAISLDDPAETMLREAAVNPAFEIGGEGVSIPNYIF
jgi:hypothetical protein